MTTAKKDTATELKANIATLPPDLLAPLASSNEKKDRRSKDGKEKKDKDGKKNKKVRKKNKKEKSRKRVRTDTPELSDSESQPPKRAHKRGPSPLPWNEAEHRTCTCTPAPSLTDAS